MKLYHTGSSYYSMIARLALAEKGMQYVSRPVDIHAAMEQLSPDFARMNPSMTVPVLALDERHLCGSDTILRGLDELAPTPRFFPEAEDARVRTEEWMTLHYALQIDEYTFSHLARRIPPMRWLMPGKLKRMRATIAERADIHPELADAYRAKVELTDFRIAHLFKPQTWKLTEKAIQDYLDRMSTSLEEAGPWLLGADYSAADVLGTVLLSRVCMAMRKREIRARPIVARYWERVRARPSFEAADIWTRLRPRTAIHILRG